jgi:sulfatase maturation enzyme AslB (radical SAM superfamily)
MDLEIAKKFIDLLLNNDDNTKNYINTTSVRGVVLDFIGGEPFLQITLISQIIDYFIE